MSKNEKMPGPVSESEQSYRDQNAPKHGYTRLFLGAIRVAGFLLTITIVALIITALT